MGINQLALSDYFQKIKVYLINFKFVIVVYNYGYIFYLDIIIA